MVVRSSPIYINVTAPSPPPPGPTRIKVHRLDISATKYSVKKGETVRITSWATFSDRVPAGKTATLYIRLKYEDPFGNTGDLGVRMARGESGEMGTNTVAWEVTPNKAGKWKFWTECPDYADLA